MAKVVVCRNPFRPQVERDLVTVRAGTRIDTMLRQQSLVKGRAGRLRRLSAFVVQVNGSYLLADQWARRIRNEDVVVVSLLPGDGGGGSNPLKMVLQVALIAAAVYTGGLAAAAWGATAGALASAGVMLAGTLLLNLAFPPPKPNVMQAREQASPTHTLSAQGNMARLQEAIPVLYGRHMIFPDFAAQPYTETDSNNTYLYQLFCVGQGELDIERIRIEETPIENFAEVSWEVVRPGGLVTLFPDNVVTSSIVQGLELKGSNEEGGGWMGPYVTNPAGTRANVIGIDISLSQGLYYANDEGGLDGATVSWRIEARPINDAGAPAGEWTLLGEERWGEATATPQIKSFRYGVPDGRFEVRAMRVGTKNLDQRCANTVSWAGLRAYLPSAQSYGNVTLLAVAMRATNNLNQSTSRRINVIATRKLPVWDPVAGWSPDVRATRNPAWALADMLRSRVYGRGMLDTAYNLPELYRLAQVWDQRRDYYDDVIDTTMTLWDALSRAARVGRAVPMYYAGLIDFVRNEPRSIPRAMFTPDNIVDGSFSINYSFIEHDSPDHVVIEYVDSETWQPAEVACVLPGGTQERPARVQLPGVSNRDQAWREGMSMAAANRDQRIVPSLQTELDGHIPNFLDLVTVVHDTPKWGLSGFVTAWDPATRRLQVSEPLEWYQGQQHYISLRQRDGTPRGPFRVTAGRDELECVLVSPPADLYVSEGEIEEPTLYAFGPGERTGLKALVRRAVPDESGHVMLELVNYADSVHSAELGGEVPPPPPASLLPLTPDAPIVAEVTVYATANPGEQIASCTPARGATTYEFEASQDQGQTWVRLGADTIPSLTIRLPVGPWWVRARGVGKNPGPWKTWQGHISATMLPPPVLTHFVASPVLWGIRLAWTWPSAIRLRYIEIWYSRTPNFLDATPLGQFAYPQGSHEMTNLAITAELYFWARVRDEADQPGPWYPESGPGVRGTPSQDAQGYNDLITPEIVGGALGELIMGDIRDIPNIRDAVGEINIDLGELNGRVDQINGQVQELLNAGEWDVGAAYAVGTVVFADGKMYRAKTAVPAGTPITSTAHWELIGDYASITDGLAALAVQAQETITRVENAEGRIQANAESISTVAGQINDPATGLSALGSAVQSMRTQVGQLQDGLQSLSEATTALSSRVDGIDWAQDAIADAVSSLTTRVTTTEGRIDSQASSITQLTGRVDGLVAPAGNLLKNSNVEHVRAPQEYAMGGYYAVRRPETGKTYTLVACVTHQPAEGDTISSVGAWAGTGSQAIDTNLVRNAVRKVVVKKFVANANGAGSNLIGFYYYPNTVKSGSATVHWACLYEGDVVPPMEWQPSIEELNAGLAANVNAVGGLTTRVEATEGGLTAQGQSITKIDARLSAGQDSDSLLPDYLMANPDCWFSHYGGTLLPRFITTTTGKVAPTVFRHTTGVSFNYNIEALPTIGRYRIRFWCRRSTNSNGSFYVTLKLVKADGTSATADYRAVLVTDRVPADGEWHLIDYTSEVAAADRDAFPRVCYGFAANHTGSLGWAEVQGFRVTRVTGAGDINPNEVATAQSVSSLSGTVTQQGNVITSQGQAVAALQNTVNDPNTGVAATAGALNDTKTRVTDIEGRQEVMASDQLILAADIKRQAPDENAALESVLNQYQTQVALAELKNVQADDMRALAESITTLQASIGQDSAAVEQIMRSMVEMEDDFAKIYAGWGIKLLANTNGVRYVAGVGLDLTNESGVMQSTFAVLADRFAVMHSINGNPVTVFSVQNGASILNTALIGYASIGQAHIADAAISRAKIQWAAIGEAQIEDAVITNAKIADAAISRAKIGHAEIDTLRLAGNSVAVHVGASAPALGSGAHPAFRDIGVTLNLPYAAQVTVKADVQNTVRTAGEPPTLPGSTLLYINGSVVESVPGITDAAQDAYWGGGLSYTTTLAAGSYWIVLQQKASIGGVNGVNRRYTAAGMSIISTMR